MNAIHWLSVICITATSVVAADGVWKNVDTMKTGQRDGSSLLYVPELKQHLLVGLAKGAPFVQAFDAETKQWSAFAEAEPFKSDFNNPNKQPNFTFQAAYDSGTRTIFCLSLGNVLYAFDTVAKTWKSAPPAPELDDLAWPTLACDSVGKRLVVVGAEKKGNELGWSRTVVYDIPTGNWHRLEVRDPQIRQEHREIVAAAEACLDLGGRVRLVWYRDPNGQGTAAEIKALVERCQSLQQLRQTAPIALLLKRVEKLLHDGKLLDALKLVKECQRTLEEHAEAQYPVPCARRNSPLVFDPVHKVFMLFGGDHQDYLLNDTWLLDLDKQAWSRVLTKHSPSPRAGHALVYLPKSGRIALYEGYVQSPSPDYGSAPWTAVTPIQLWLFDGATNRWSIAGTWTPPQKDTGETIAPVAYFYGGESYNRFAGPALAADTTDRLVLVGTDTQKSHWARWRRPASTWMLQVDATRIDQSATAKLGTAPNQRLYRPGLFRAEYAEVDLPAPSPDLNKLPANQWVKLPAAPRNPAQGCRARDWSTSVWDSDRDQILLWGGGHCVRSSSTVLHYSPRSGRIVEGFDADESYGSNSPADGTLARDSTLLGRPWVSVHSYKHYAYDPPSKLLVAGRGYVYDPDRMDWLRQEKQTLPYLFRWGATVLASSRHGAVAWAEKPKGEVGGLWLYEHGRGWRDLEPQGKLGIPWCDTHGMVYDTKRNRMLLSGIGGGYDKTCDGSFLAYDFATKALSSVQPQNPDLGKTRGCLRELAYVEHADWVLLGLNLQVGNPKTGKAYTRVYDCAANKYYLLDAGPVPDSHESGWMYDAKRKLVYSFSTHAQAWAIRIDPTTAKLLEAAGP